MGDLTSIFPTLVSDRNSESVPGTETDTEFRSDTNVGKIEVKSPSVFHLELE